MTRKTLSALTASQTPLITAAMRYRVITAGALHAMLQSPSEEAADKALKRLNRRGWLHQIRLPDRQSCYVLSRDAVLALALSKKAMKAMGQAAVITNLAMSWFCARQKVERLIPDEVRAAIPELDKPGLQVGNYYTDHSADPARLTWMLVDRGFAQDVLIRKVEKIVKKAYRFPSLVQLMQSGQFGITILVPNDRKKWLVERTLSRRYFAHVAVSVAVVSEIQSLLLS